MNTHTICGICLSGYHYTTKLFGFLDQYTNETCDDDSLKNESDSDVTLEFSGSIVDCMSIFNIQLDNAQRTRHSDWYMGKLVKL